MKMVSVGLEFVEHVFTMIPDLRMERPGWLHNCLWDSNYDLKTNGTQC